jgi:hypothetical protein
MAHFLTKIPNLGEFWMDLQRKILVYVMAFWYILRPFDIICGHMVYFMVISPRFGMLYQEKSGNPAGNAARKVARGGLPPRFFSAKLFSRKIS